MFTHERIEGNLCSAKNKLVVGAETVRFAWPSSPPAGRFQRSEPFDKCSNEGRDQKRGARLHYLEGHSGCEAQIVALFEDTFTQSENAGEGALIAKLAGELMQAAPPKDILVLSAQAQDSRRLAGCIFLSRLSCAGDDRALFILSPVAVAPRFQRQGVGQGLIRHGLDRLREQGVAYCVTYGDPAYYSRIGFRQISPKMVRPPLPLSHPDGWLGQSLTKAEQAPFAGRSTCVDALARPEYW